MSVEKRLGQAVSKAGHICGNVKSEIGSAAMKLPEVYDNLDIIIGGAH